MVSFKGTLVNSASVIRDYNFVAVTSNYPTSFAEVNPTDASDADALKRTSYIFGNRGADASLISDIFQYEGENTNNIKSRYFVLTEQNDDLERIKPTAVLGLTKTTDMGDDNVFIDMIQVNPFYVFNNPYSHLKRCGTTIIESLARTFANKDLWLHAPRNLVDYFKRRGFEIADISQNKGDVLMKFSRHVPKGAMK